MTANDSTPPEGDETSGIEDTTDIENMLHTEGIQYADNRGFDPEAVAECLRAHADALETNGYERFRPGL